MFRYNNISDYNKRLILLSVIPSSGEHCKFNDLPCKKLSVNLILCAKRRFLLKNLFRDFSVKVILSIGKFVVFSTRKENLGRTWKGNNKKWNFFRAASNRTDFHPVFSHFIVLLWSCLSLPDSEIVTTIICPYRCIN